MIIQVLSTFFAIAAASIYLEVPRKMLIRAGIVGAMGWGIYLLLLEKTGLLIATFIAGIVVSTVSHIFSRLFKTPVTIFFIPGFYPLVPGYRFYMAVYNFIAGNQLETQEYLIDTIKISGMIALSIFTMDITFNIITKLRHLIPQD